MKHVNQFGKVDALPSTFLGGLRRSSIATELLTGTGLLKGEGVLFDGPLTLIGNTFLKSIEPSTTCSLVKH